MAESLWQVDFVHPITVYPIGIFTSREDADKCIEYARAHPTDGEGEGTYEDAFDGPVDLVTFEEWKADWDRDLELDDNKEEIDG